LKLTEYVKSLAETVDGDWHDSYEETGQMLQEFKTNSIWANMGEALSGNSHVCTDRLGNNHAFSSRKGWVMDGGKKQCMDVWIGGLVQTILGPGLP
jgi:hypothetical protein